MKDILNDVGKEVLNLEVFKELNEEFREAKIEDFSKILIERADRLPEDFL